MMRQYMECADGRLELVRQAPYSFDRYLLWAQDCGLGVFIVIDGTLSHKAIRADHR